MSIIQFLPIAGRVVPGIVLRSLLLGPFAVACTIGSYCLFSRELSAENMVWGFLAVTIGGVFSGFAILAASLVVFTPILWIEMQGGKLVHDGQYLFKKYLPVICLLTLLGGTLLVLSDANLVVHPVEPMPVCLLISFHLTGSLALWLFSQSVYQKSR